MRQSCPPIRRARECVDEDDRRYDEGGGRPGSEENRPAGALDQRLERGGAGGAGAGGIEAGRPDRDRAVTGGDGEDAAADAALAGQADAEGELARIVVMAAQ